MTQVARDVPDPERGVSVLERLKARELANTKESEKLKELRDRELIRLDALGSGSDYTPFIQHLGIAALNIGYGGEDGGGSYHSIYDSFDHYVRFGDPNFDYGVTQAKTTGRLVLRLANADVLPFEFSTMANTVSRYADEVTKLAEDFAARHRRAQPHDQRPHARDRRGSDETVCRAEDSGAGAVSQLCAAAERGCASEESGERVRQGRTILVVAGARSGDHAHRAIADALRKVCRGARGSAIRSTRPASTRATASRLCPACARPSSRRTGRKRTSRSRSCRR